MLATLASAVATCAAGSVCAMDTSVLCGRISGSYFAGLQNIRDQYEMGDRGNHVTQIVSVDDLKPFMRQCMHYGDHHCNHPWSPHQPNAQALRCLWSTLCWVLCKLLAEYTFTSDLHEYGDSSNLSGPPSLEHAPAHFQVLLWERRCD